MKNTLIIGVLALMLGWVVFDNFIAKEQHDSTKEVEDAIASSGFSTEETLQGVGLEKEMQAPNFTLETVDGVEVKLSDLQGKKVVLNFWATWCPPCKAEMPEMEKFYQEYSKDGVEILAVNLTTVETSAVSVEKFVDEYDINFPILMDVDNKVGRKYQIKPIPTSYLIDEEGIIQHKIIGPMTYDWLKEQMKQL